jgi:hypothetical protein
MIDKWRVIKSLECHFDTKLDCSDCIYNLGYNCLSSLLKDALKLLKEQPDIVRCGECKYYSNGFCYNPNTFDEKTCGNTVPDWFCADGRRQEAE